MKAFHENRPNIHVHGHPESDSIQSQFESMHCALQRKIDSKTIASFESGRLLCKDQSTGDMYTPDKIFVPSLTYLVPTPNKSDQENYEIRGGWVNRNKAKQLVAETARNAEKRDEIAKHTAPIALRHLFGRVPSPAFEAA